MTEETKHFYEFGAFRVDPGKRLLLRDNHPIPIQPKAFETLLVLIRNSETIVLKDDLMKSVWPNTFVEESNLAQNIFVLRKTLGEAADRRFILTIPGRGYQFTEKVRFVPQQDELTVQSPDDLVVQRRSISRVLIDEQSRPGPPDVIWRRIGIFGIAAAALLGGILYWKSATTISPARQLSGKGSIVVADFTNTTGDSVFDGALRQGLSAQLEQSPLLNLLSDQRINQTLSLMGQGMPGQNKAEKSKDTRLTPETAREVCQRTASAAVLDGSIAQLGSRYLLTLKALDCASGETLAITEAEANDKTHVLDALGKIASVTRNKLGESLASVQKYDVPPENVTTPSLEALHSYSLGMKARTGNYTGCIPLFERAIELDSNFAMAYAQLGVIYVNMGESARGADYIGKAYELRDRVSEREKLYIASHYDENVVGDLEAARRDYELWEHLYPRDPIPPSNLNVIYFYLGDYDKVLTFTQQAMDLRGGSKLSPNLVSAYIFVNRLDEAKAMALQAATEHVDDPLFHMNLYDIDFLRHDAAAMKREADGLVSNPTWGDAACSLEANTAAYSGQFAKARELTLRASDLAQRSQKKQTAALYESEAAINEALVGNAAFAKRQVRSALALSNGKDVEAMSALALSLAGDSTSALRMAADLSKRFPHDTIMQFNYLPTIRAAAEIQGDVRTGNSGKAIKDLEAAAPYESGTTALDVGIDYYPVYVRGEAYLAAKKGSSAAAEFQKILDHSGVVQNEPIGALARLGLARADALAGNINEARSAYRDFFDLWKGADPDIPILKAARAEYLKLQ
jgi:DNA-binding winged helix-turn-helix (wHTH) protein